jgi:predicted dehydrogenase/NADPH:quinone reductase-like Zn-dependent oxidoreductase
MKQVLIGSTGALLARMPAPAVEPGTVVVRVRYSLISTGTEIAALRPITSSIQGASALDQAADLSNMAALYLGKAARNPRKAVERATQLIKSYVANRLPRSSASTDPQRAPIVIGQVAWYQAAASVFETDAGRLVITTDDSPGSYQAMSPEVAVPPGYSFELRLAGTLAGASVGIGILNQDRSSWLAQVSLDMGDFKEVVSFDVPESAPSVTAVIFNTGTREPATLTLETAEIVLNPPDGSGLPASEMNAQGWNVGYSAAGVVVAVGEGIDDIAAGDLVACGGAGQANHAEFIAVKRNLVAKVPHNCPLRLAATTTVGTIAMQGVRRADARLGETVLVIGLGLIGMITVLLLRAAGVRAIGIDLDPARVAKASALGIDAATTEASELTRIVRDLTGSHGVDQTIITAASKSHALINQAMELTRRRGRVVIVGDIGLKPERSHFYRKEIDLVMSTSYGPGRYDASYEEMGRDYPYAYVRWTLNRNMQAYLDLIANGRIDIDSLIEQVVPIDSAPEAYRVLANASGPLPLGVLLEYPDGDARGAAAEYTRRITLRGHRSARQGRINYALVGAGAFGTSMLVPMLDKCGDRFFLRAVVSRDAVRGGNFARSRRVEVLSSDFGEILKDPDIDLVVIATRHDDHAAKAAAALEAGKAVFVEKPLALNWSGLEQVRKAYQHAEHPFLMVGFNRRFAPAVQRLRERIAGRRSPLMMNYRLNGGFIPADHWIQGEQGGGRNIGEACHMYDLFNALSGASVRSISASAIDPGETAYRRNDNFVATLSYEDGSTANLVYTALGPKEGLPKERLEVFCDGEAWILDDFKALSCAGTGEVLWQAGTANKGHFEQMSQLGSALASGDDAPISFDEIMLATATSLHVEDLIFGRVPP